MLVPPPASWSVMCFPSPSRSASALPVTVQGPPLRPLLKTATEVTSSAAVWSRLRLASVGSQRACEACFTPSQPPFPVIEPEPSRQ